MSSSLGVILSSTETSSMYTLKDFEEDIERIKPRAFDTWILPAFLAGYAIKSRGMPKTARRILFSSAIYMSYRNYSVYKKQFLALRQKLSQEEPNADS